MAAFNKDAFYLINSGSRIGNYDFDKGGFAINVGNSLSISTGLSGFITIVLGNTENFNFVSIDPDAANDYLQMRTDYTGYVWREVILQIKFKFADLNQSSFVALTKGYKGYFLNATIQSIKVYGKRGARSDDIDYLGEMIKK